MHAVMNGMLRAMQIGFSQADQELWDWGIAGQFGKRVYARDSPALAAAISGTHSRNTVPDGEPVQLLKLREPPCFCAMRFEIHRPKPLP